MNLASRVEPQGEIPRVLHGLPAAVIVLSYYPWDPRVRRETEAMAAAGMDIDLFCLRETEAQPGRERINGVNVFRLGLRHVRGGFRRYVVEYGCFFLWATWRLTWKSIRRGYRLVHVHNMPDLLVFTTLLPRMLGAKIILDLHDPMPELFQTIFGLGPDHPLVRCLMIAERMSARYAHVVLTPNLRFCQLFARRTQQPHKFNVVMNSPAEEIFSPGVAHADPETMPPAERPFRIMYHGLIAERHGLDILLAAVKIISADIPNARLDIYGAESPYLETVQRLIGELELESRVRYHGKKSLAEIASIIETIDLGVIPNRRTPFTELNFPTRIFEYLALRKPVIALKTAGVRDYFKDDELFFLDSDDPLALARLIRSLHDHPFEAQQVVQRGYEVYRRHCWSGERQRFIAMVTQLVLTGQTFFG